MLSRALITDADQKFSSQYRSELANHLPMDLVALERMGASLERLTSYRDHYVKRLESRSFASHFGITEENWKQYLGAHKHEAEYLNYFNLRLGGNGLKQTLEDHLPHLFVGVAGGAFHGLIRLAYALDANNLEEVAEALAYWAISFLDLGVRTLSVGSIGPVDIFAELSAEFIGTKFDAPNIARRMERIGKLIRFREICGQVDKAQISHPVMAPLVLALFAQTQDFTALHAVTATHAYRLVSHYVPAPHEMFIGLAAAYVSIRAPKITDTEQVSSLLAWDELMQHAVASNDDHVPKIVYSCHEEFKVNENPVYFHAAAKYTSRLEKLTWLGGSDPEAKAPPRSKS